jgi:hypothetical protein
MAWRKSASAVNGETRKKMKEEKTFLSLGFAQWSEHFAYSKSFVVNQPSETSTFFSFFFLARVKNSCFSALFGKSIMHDDVNGQCNIINDLCLRMSFHKFHVNNVSPFHARDKRRTGRRLGNKTAEILNMRSMVSE